MRLEHTFMVPAPIDQAWATLMDVERVAPCMPGATLTSVDADEFTGGVKVKLGPIALSYGMTGRFVEQDPVSRRAVIEAQGKERKGSGTAAAQIELMLKELSDASTQADVAIDLDITGRPAQFGRTALADVSSNLVGQFAKKLAVTMAAPSAEPEPPAPSSDTAQAPSASPNTADSDEALDVVGLIVLPLVRRAAPAAGALAGLLILLRLLRGRRR